MSYIKLNDVTASHLLGAWKVKNRQTNSSNAGNLFAKCSCLKFSDNAKFTITSQSGKLKRGQWRIVREQEMIYNPQVRFRLGQEELANSIITNLMTDDQIHFKLILYFDSGLELVLERDEKNLSCRKTKKAQKA